MFTGIVEELGHVVETRANASGVRLRIAASVVLDDVELGASIAVNGCCLTVVEFGAGEWSADVVEESVRRTNLGGLRAGDPVNLERPVRLVDRLGGHLVQGHIDGVGQVREIAANADGSTTVWVGAPDAVTRYVVEKGSIAVDGVSLTVAALGPDGFAFAMIPHTAAVTTLGHAAPGTVVNLEVDLVAKYVERVVTHLVTTSP